MSAPDTQPELGEVVGSLHSLLRMTPAENLQQHQLQASQTPQILQPPHEQSLTAVPQPQPARSSLRAPQNPQNPQNPQPPAPQLQANRGSNHGGPAMHHVLAPTYVSQQPRWQAPASDPAGPSEPPSEHVDLLGAVPRHDPPLHPTLLAHMAAICAHLENPQMFKIRSTGQDAETGLPTHVLYMARCDGYMIGSVHMIVVTVPAINGTSPLLFPKTAHLADIEYDSVQLRTMDEAFGITHKHRISGMSPASRSEVIKAAIVRVDAASNDSVTMYASEALPFFSIAVVHRTIGQGDTLAANGTLLAAMQTWSTVISTAPPE
jgi:hypothetical protein